MRQLSEIIIHCTATRPEWMLSRPLSEKSAEIRRWHVEGNGWSDIGYHWLIDRSGAIEAGRPLERVGAHVKGRNGSSIGIALLGGHGGSETDSFDDHFTAEQEAALRGLIAEMQSTYGAMNVVGHNQFAAKACPCFHVPAWFNGSSASRKYIPESVERVIKDANKPPSGSTTNWGALSGIAASTWAAWQAADPMVQAAMLGVIAVLLYVMRERLRKSKLGQRAMERLGI